MPGLGEHHRRREQHHAIDVRREPFRGENRQRAAEARPDQRHRLRPCRSDFPCELIEHPRHRQRREIGTIEIGRSEHDTMGEEPLGEVRRLRRLVR